ncbi:hypothetical protein QFC22_003808 [Naganishia vaughanmartiniae]|uniref:Uncharacterized protein n=1 Tax=Naganishia vaughanmartiniae TaxID=1424756 RepID=A0ACC2X487_9TREE|nr:hypothetical protein QFC22_003808 [Naganishia vaughanmartiniae]
MASYGIDSILVARPYLPVLINNVLPATKILSEISYYSNLAGLVLLVPAVITGFHEWWEIAKFKGENKFVDGVKVQSYPDRAFNVATIHGLLNVAVGAYSLYSWRARRLLPNHMPTTKMGLASAGMLVGLIGSAAAGGALVYEFGMGVQRQGSGVDERKKMFGSGGGEKKAQ